MTETRKYTCIYCDKEFTLVELEAHEPLCKQNPDNKTAVFEPVPLEEAAKSKVNLEKHIGHKIEQAEKFLLLPVPDEDGKLVLRLILTPEDPEAKAIWIDFRYLMLEVAKYKKELDSKMGISPKSKITPKVTDYVR
jgi:hypothetical protein